MIHIENTNTVYAVTFHFPFSIVLLVPFIPHFSSISNHWQFDDIFLPSGAIELAERHRSFIY